jgi:dipeptidyl aminopeptidase/acylaminoacyl peptidase
VERWTSELSLAGEDRKRFSEAELVRWKSFDGKTNSWILIPGRRPASFRGRRPVLVNNHVRPEGRAPQSAVRARAAATKSTE